MQAAPSYLVPHHVPTPDPVYGPPETWIADLVTSAILLVREAATDVQAAVTSLTSLESRVAWEGPAARAFRSRADQLCGTGTQSADALEVVLDDLRAVRERVCALLGDAV